MSLQDGLNFLIDTYPRPTTIRIVCAWHPKNFGTEFIMGYKEGKGQTGDSHTICPGCLKIEEDKIAKV